MAGSVFGGGQFAGMAGAPQAMQMAYMRDPRLRLAQQLALQGSDTSAVQSPWQGAARLAQALMGGWQSSRVNDEYAKQAEQYQNDMRALYAPVQELQAGASGAGPRPDAQMTTRPANIQEMTARIGNLQSPYALQEARGIQQLALQQQAALEAEARAAARDANKPVNLRPGERRIDPATGRVLAENPVAERPQAPPASVAEFQFAQQNGFRGNFMDFQRARAQASRTDTGGPFGGSGIEAQHFNNLLTLQPNDPRYAVSFNALYGRRAVTQADGTTVEIQPPIPQGIQPPAMAGQAAPQAPVPSSAPMAAPETPAPQTAPGQVAPNVTTVQTPGGATVTRIGSPREKDLTEAQAKANLFGGQMTRAENILSEIRVPSNAAIAAWRNFPEGAVNLGLNENDQQYFNAIRLFAAGVLRKETGAAFTTPELLDVQSRFFPMPGDGPRVAAQKAENRRQAMESIRAELPSGQFRGLVQPREGGAAPATSAPPPPPGFRVVQ